MRKVIRFFILTLMLLFPTAVQAQAPVIDTLQIDIWPEYDRSEMLIIYRFSLADSTSLPAELTLRIPASSGGPFNVAFKDLNENGEASLFTLEYTTTQTGDWIEVAFTAPVADLQLEYYDPAIHRSADLRDFVFTWPADYTVNSMSVQVQQPYNATQLQIEPELGDTQVKQDGLTYYGALFGQIEAGEQFSVNISYEKPDDTLSMGYDSVFAADSISQSGQTPFENVWPWILGGLGVLLVLGAAIWYLAPQGKQTAAPRKRHTPSTFKEEKGAQDASPQGVFCHNCGTQSQSGDQYCRSCGTKLRQ